MAGQVAVTIDDKPWSADLATAPWELTQGLGGIPGIPLGTGMLFDLGFEQAISVTTEPMLFPLDIAFLSESLWSRRCIAIYSRDTWFTRLYPPGTSWKSTPVSWTASMRATRLYLIIWLL